MNSQDSAPLLRLSEQIFICSLQNQNRLNYFRSTAMLKCYSFGKSLTFKAKITSVSLHPSHLNPLCVHCEMGDFKHLRRKIITAPLHLIGCVQQLLPYKLWATRSFAKRAESFRRPMGASDMTDVYLESSHQHQDHIFKALCGIQQLGCAH